MCEQPEQVNIVTCQACGKAGTNLMISELEGYLLCRECRRNVVQEQENG